jgi:hypothetical protein
LIHFELEFWLLLIHFVLDCWLLLIHFELEFWLLLIHFVLDCWLLLIQYKLTSAKHLRREAVCSLFERKKNNIFLEIQVKKKEKKSTFLDQANTVKAK